ncbi:hypothetical protein [Citreimonas sp.]|uniref:hypothetical protein n=1 Tax=Citreimonas sp. TaxID=3036715 RepID=UPI004058A60B
MTRFLPLLPLVLALSACAQVERLTGGTASPQAAGADAPAAAEQAQAPRPPAPPAGAATAEQFDTTTEADRAAATEAPSGGETRLGEVVVSLGDVARPGFWLETPLVSTETEGRVEAPGGASAKVTLEPAEDGTGSRISLPAMRLLEVPLTDLPTLTVYATE